MSLVSDFRNESGRLLRAAWGGVSHGVDSYLSSNALTKAAGAAAADLQPQGKPPQPKSWDIDPQDVNAMLTEQMSGPSHPGSLGLTYDTLRTMSRYPLVSMVLGTQINHIAEYCVPKVNPHRVGYEIVMRDKNAQLTRAAEKRRAELSAFLQTCGDPRIQARGNANLEVFARKIMRDSLTFDQACFEVVHTRGGRPAGMIAMDAATVRRAQFTREELELGRRLPDETAYVQVVNNRVVARFEPEELCFGVRRPRTDLRYNGYGYPELENLVRTVTNLVNAETYNANNFTNGMHAAGLLAIKSKMSPQLFRAFRREFYAMLSGANNAKKTPIIQLDPDEKEEIQSVNLSSNNKEMEFALWQSFLIKVLCGEFQMDPAEVGFLFGNEGQTGSLSQGGPEERIIASRERGLYPTLRCLQRWIDDSFIFPLDPDFMLSFGVDVQTEKEKLDLVLAKVGKVCTVNEGRAELDYKPLPKLTPDLDPADWGPLDPTYINALEQRLAALQQPDAGEQPPGGEGDYPDYGDGGDQGGDNEPPVDMSALYGNASGETTAKSLRAGRKLRIVV